MTDEQDDQIVSDDVVAPGNTEKRHGIRDLASRLYQGDAGIDVVGKRKIFYGVALAIVAIFLVTISVHRFNLGIEFKGGNSFTVPASVGTLSDVRASVERPQRKARQLTGGCCRAPPPKGDDTSLPYSNAR